MLASGDRLRSWALAHDDPASYTPPPAFGPFRVLHQIGVGVLGPVFRAYDSARDRLAAVKVFRLDLPPEQLRVFLTELQGLCEIGLEHPGIAAPLAAAAEGGAVYLASEYLAWDSLDRRFRVRVTAGLEEVAALLAQLGDAVDYARARGVGHGALHPRDIFLGPDRACATGFGIAQALERAGAHAPVRRPYAAPERIAGASWSTPADVFSLAVMAHEWLTGKRPSGASRVAHLARRPAPSQADALQKVMARALAEHPDDRYRTARAFAAAFEALSQVTAGEMSPDEVAQPQADVDFDLRIEEPAAEAGAAPPIEVVDLELEASPGTEPSPRGEPGVSLLDLAEAGDEAGANIGARENIGDQAPEEDGAAAAPLEATGGGEVWEAGAAGVARQAPPAESPAVGEAAPVEALAAEERTATPPGGEDRSKEGELGDEEGELAASLDRPRAAIFPYAVVLMVGMLAGFLAGYALGSRERASGGERAAPQASEPARPVAVSEAPPQPFTEAAVPSASPAGAPLASPGVLATGRLLVRSTPAAATVRVDGVVQGTTPLSVAGLAFGTYRVEVARRGYASVAREVTLTSSAPSRELVVQLEPTAAGRQNLTRVAPSGAPARRAQTSGAGALRPPGSAPAGGTLVALSRPAGARVVLDGRVVGRTPLTLKGLKPGPYTIGLELDGYRVWRTQVLVSSGRETRVAGSLDPVRKR